MRPRWIFAPALAVCLLAGPGSRLPAQQGTITAEPALEIEDYQQIAEHSAGRHRPVRMVLQDRTGLFTGVEILLLVSETGDVLSATVVRGPAEAQPAALAEAKTWKYQPFEKDGQAVVAKVHDYVRILPPEDLPKEHREFPRLGSNAGVVMALKRTGCYGTCSSYEVEVHGDGTVVYHGHGFVVVEGEHRDRISAEQVEELVEAFRKADYFSLKDDYHCLVTDNPTYETSFQVDAVKKTVTDYVGPEAGMPQVVSDLEEQIDHLAGTEKWLRGNSQTVPSLKREGWDFQSPEAGQTLARAAAAGRSALVQDFLKEGTGSAKAWKEEGSLSALAGAAQAGDQKLLETLLKAGVGKNDATAKTEGLAAAALRGDPEMVRQLLAYGGDPKGLGTGLYPGMTVLMAASSSAVPEVVELILAGHPDVNARDAQGRTAPWYVTDGNDRQDATRHSNRALVIHLLAKAGANLNSQDESGNTALHQAYAGNVAQALIENGADVNARNNTGRTPLMSNFSLEAAKLLVAAGADLHAKSNEGKTALDYAQGLEPEGERTKFLRSVQSAKTAPKSKP